jgi:hypothetical protein
MKESVCEACGQDKPVEPYRIDSRPNGVMLCDECYEGCMTEGNEFTPYKEEEASSPSWNNPKSACACGHDGDGPHSAHGSEFRFSIGHGPCKVVGCDCKQFTWAGWLPDYKTFAGLK